MEFLLLGLHVFLMVFWLSAGIMHLQISDTLESLACFLLFAGSSCAVCSLSFVSAVLNISDYSVSFFSAASLVFILAGFVFQLLIQSYN